MPFTESKEDVMLDGFDFLRGPTALQLARMESISGAAMNLARTIANTVPPGADRSAAIRKLREAVMTANAGIVLGPEQF